VTFVEVGWRAARALKSSPHELLFEFSRGYVMRCGGEIVWFDEDREAFSPCGVTLPVIPSVARNLGGRAEQECRFTLPTHDAVAHFLLDHNPAHLLGLGHGLTPAGDDFLGGWFLVRHRRGHRESIDTAATHEISRARLAMHINGEWTRAEVRFVDALLGGGDVDAAARILRNHGHSSGDDFMRGARAAVSA